MLIRFSVANYLSFNEETHFSLIAGRTRKHGNHVVRPESSGDIPLLKTSLLYGANASGKSNLVRAMEFSRDLIRFGANKNDSISVTPFKLAAEAYTKPCFFEFEFRAGDKNYAYGLRLDASAIHEEWLYEVSRNKEKCLFERNTKQNETKFQFPGIRFQNQKERQFLEFVADGTRKNQPFLTECQERNVAENLKGAQDLANAYNWFHDVLTIVTPETKYGALEVQFQDNNQWGQTFTSYLKSLDTGIADIELVQEDTEKVLSQFPDALRHEIENKEQAHYGLVIEGKGNFRYLIRKEGKQNLRVFKLMTKHEKTIGEGYEYFELSEESDGTQRLMDLIPGLMEMHNTSKVYVIDELDRSIHPKLSWQLLRLFLKEEVPNSQLIATTHEASLLDQDFLRKDEIWFVEKDEKGATTLYALDDFKPRFDKDIRRGYLLGRFGAVPAITD